MAASGYGSPYADQVRRMTTEVKTLVNARLKDVLREEGLPVSGVKSELQIRIIAHIEKLANAGDIGRLNRVHNTMNSRPSSFASYSAFTPSSSTSPSYSSPTNMASSGVYQTKQLSFKPSPFYKIVRPLTSVVECRAREHTRDTARLTISLNLETAERLHNDENARVMVFCAAESYTAQSDIGFPHQVELKCNSDEVKTNLRGLKNKPGSTRPADITHLIRRKPNYPNNVEMVYALTQKAKPALQKFFLVINLVEKQTIDDLVSRRKAHVIGKEQVLREMTRKNNDVDIEATSTVLSLKCPLSAMRISVPMRSSSCLHNQCFDAASYLQLQEQAPTWTCPICNRAAPFETLLMDLYVNDILQSTSADTEQVIIEPDGQWHLQGSSNSSRLNGNPTPDDEYDDEGFIEIRDDRISNLKSESRLPPLSTIRTPPMSSREQSIASSSAPRSNKRPAAEVIDLTLSDDDDDARPAKIKRPSMSSTRPFSTSSGGSVRPYDHYSFELPRPSFPSFTTSPLNPN